MKQLAKEFLKLLALLVIGVLLFLPVALGLLAIFFNNILGGNICSSILVGVGNLALGIYLMYLYPVLIWVSIGLGATVNIALIIYEKQAQRRFREE